MTSTSSTATRKDCSDRRCCRLDRLPVAKARSAKRPQISGGLLKHGDRRGGAAGQRRIVEIDREQTEAALRAVRPLEVVDQRPVQVADDVDAFGPRAIDGVEVRAQEVRTLRV